MAIISFLKFGDFEMQNTKKIRNDCKIEKQQHKTETLYLLHCEHQAAQQLQKGSNLVFLQGSKMAENVAKRERPLSWLARRPVLAGARLAPASLVLLANTCPKP